MAEESQQPQIAIAEAIHLLQTFRGADLTQTIYEIEKSVRGVSAERYSEVLATSRAKAEILGAAGLVSVAQAFLDDGVAANRVFPNPAGDIAPVHPIVQVDIDRALSQQRRRVGEELALLNRILTLNRPSPARHGRPTLACVPPSHLKFQVAFIGVERSLVGALND